MGISKPSSCESCPLHTMGTGWVPLEQNNTDILVVGEAPGENEANEGKPFVGAAGKHLRWLLSLRGMQREDFSIHNVLSCRPPDNKLRGEWYEGAAIQHCSANLDATINKVRPRVIVALGNTPLRRLCGVDGIDRLRGFVLSTYDGIPVVPTYHPSYLLPRKGQPSTSHHIPLVIRDLLLARRIAQHGFEREVFTVLEDPTPVEFSAYVDAYEKALSQDPDLPLAVDIETPYKLNHKDEEEFDEVDTQIVRISFGYERGRAVSIPWDTPWMPMIKRLLASAGRKWWWNGWTFDVPIIQAQGVEIKGVQEDMMWAFHLLHPDLRYGLERATSLYAPDLPPWKHESQARPAYYSGMDSIALMRTGMGIEQELRSCGMWELFQKHRVKVYPTLREAGQNGINIDRKERRKLYKTLRKEEKKLLAQIQPLVPDVLRPRKRYKKFPVVHAGHRAIEPVSLRGEVKRCTNCGAENVKASEHTARKGGKKGIPLNGCYKAPIEKVEGDVTHYDVVMDFNPLSVDQLMSYVEHFGHPAGTNYKTKSKTLNDLQLEKLEAKYGEAHPIYGHVRELRTVRKTISTYIVGLKPNAEGVVRTEYSFKPATGRLSSKGIRQGEDRGTNLQNIPHRGDHPYADDIRRMIVPPPGYVFVEADSSSIEAVMTGHFMDDAEYIALAQQGIHAYVTCKELGLEFTPENVKKVKAEHQVVYERNKRTNHGVNYGMGAWLMAQNYPAIYKTQAEAKAAIDNLYRLLPKLRDYHHSIRVRAAKDTYLVSPWKYRRYFYDVFQYVKDREGNVIIDPLTGKPKIKLGEDSKAVIAQNSQNGAAAFMLDNAPIIAKRVKALGCILPGNFLIHDSYAICVPDDPKTIEAVADVLEEVLTRPIPELNGLRVGCEIKCGKDWGPGMKVIRTVKV